jgi:transcriptional regulator with XRE-family HTH domain
MTPIKKRKYEFQKESLIDVRKRLGLSQTNMAKLLGIPANTLSRWEIGATVPDANKLAAFYSIAREYGFSPDFFSSENESKAFRYNLVVFWDFQTLGTPLYMIKQSSESIEVELNRRFSGTIPLFKAFTHSSQGQASDLLEDMGWRVWIGGQEIFEDIVEQARSDSGQNPKKTILVLITSDNNFKELIFNLKEQGVQVYVMSPLTLNNQLLNQVGQKFSIYWSPMILEYPKR